MVDFYSGSIGGLRGPGLTSGDYATLDAKVAAAQAARDVALVGGGLATASFATRAAFVAGIGGAEANAFVFVQSDETGGGQPAIYQKVSGAPVRTYLYRDTQLITTCESLGALPTDVDHNPVITAAIAQAITDGTYHVALKPNALYKVRQQTQPGRAPYAAGIQLLSGVRLDGRGATIRVDQANEIFRANDVPSVKAIVTADIAAGATVIPVPNASLFTAGDRVLWRLGDWAPDPPETLNFSYAKVLTVNTGANTITLDRPVNTAFALAGQTNNKQIEKYSPLLEDFVIENLRFDTLAGVSAEAGIHLRFARNGIIRNVSGREPGNSIVNLQYCENISLENTHTRQSTLTASSKGGSLAFSECRGIRVYNHRSEACQNVGISCEDNSEVQVYGWTDVNTFVPGSLPGSPGYVRNIIGASAGSIISIYDMAIEGYGGCSIFAGNSNSPLGRCRINNLRLDLDSNPTVLPTIGHGVTGMFIYRIAGVEEVYHTDDAYWWERVVFFDGTYNAFLGPPGILCDLKIFTSAGAVLSLLQVGRETDNISDYSGTVVAGSEVTFRQTHGGYDVHFIKRGERLRVNVQGNSSTPAGSFVRIRAQMLPPRNDGNATSAQVLATADVLKNAGVNIIPVKTSIDLPSVAGGARYDQSVTVTGAALGDYVTAVSINAASAGTLLIEGATVTAANTVMIHVLNTNPTTATDPGPLSFYFEVVKQRLNS